MNEIITSIKNYISCFVLGVVCGGVCVFLFLHNSSNRDIPATQVTTTTVSGDAQSVNNVHTSNGALLLTTTATGAGTSTTSIPIKLIPEANAWLTKRHTVLAKAYYLWTPDGFYPGFGIDYYYRIDQLLFGGGIIFAQKYAGVSAGAGLLF